MPPHAAPFILASASPRRRVLLRSAGLEFEVRPSDVPEVAAPGEGPAAFVRRVARDKCQAVAGQRDAGDLRPVLAADTVVVLDQDIIGKPPDRAVARQMLRRMSGRCHVVTTGVCLAAGGDLLQFEVNTEVRFKPLSAAEIEAYLEAGEWQDKAGGYAVQGGAAYMVEAVNGSYTNVVGLPLAQTVEALRAALAGGGEPGA